MCATLEIRSGIFDYYSPVKGAECSTPNLILFKWKKLISPLICKINKFDDEKYVGKKSIDCIERVWGLNNNEAEKWSEFKYNSSHVSDFLFPLAFGAPKVTFFSFFFACNNREFRVKWRDEIYAQGSLAMQIFRLEIYHLVAIFNFPPKFSRKVNAIFLPRKIIIFRIRTYIHTYNILLCNISADIEPLRIQFDMKENFHIKKYFIHISITNWTDTLINIYTITYREPYLL